MLDPISIPELVQWLEHLSVKKLITTAPSASNFLLVVYCFHYLVKRKGCFIVAFIISEIAGTTSLFNNLDSIAYYLMYANIYVVMYYHLHKSAYDLSVLLACVLMILFDLGNAIDAAIYSDSETYINQNYVAIAVSLHIILFASTFNLEKVFTNTRRFLDSFAVYFCANYNYAYYCYNTGKVTSK